MKRKRLYQAGVQALSGIILAMPILTGQPVAAQLDDDHSKTLSPYFMIPGGDETTDRIPLLSTAADVNIAGVIADVRISQVYKNEGEKPIEAVYVFPASTRAAVYSMQMTIGERKIIAKIEERVKAREAYEEARENGQSASLLEQERPNVFSMNVANIMPGDTIKVEMSYTELLVPEEGIYEFVYPTVVGPRYSGGTIDKPMANDAWTENPYTREGEAPLFEFDIRASISAGLPIQEVSCRTHDMDIEFNEPSRVRLQLKEGEASAGNRDVVIRYRLAGGQIESGLLLYEGREENFFLAMVQPPARPEISQIPPREYVFILDVSGSMWGYPLDVSRAMMRKLLNELRPSDRFNILLFAGGSSLYAEQSVKASEDNINKAIAFIDKQHGGGGTELLPALKRALSLKPMEICTKFKAGITLSRSFVILTDGYVSVEKEAFDLIRNMLGEANFFPFGIGTSVNRYLIEGMAHAGMASPFVVTSAEQATAVADRFREYISQPVLTDIEIAYHGFDAYDTEPLSMPDVLAGRPLVIFGKYRGKAEGNISISGISGDGRYTSVLKIGDYRADSKNAGLAYLWAREKIRMLDDYASLDRYTDEYEERITALGLRYNLLTRFTSFVAIDNLVRNEDGTYTTVSQPLPLPEGVSNYAVGGVSAYGAQKSSSRSIFPASGGAGQTMDCEDASQPLYEVSGDQDKEEVFSVVDRIAEFTGNKKGILAYFKENMAYPSDALSAGLEGKVLVEFNIGTDGSVSDVEVLSSTDKVFEDEAVRLVSLTDKLWKAAVYDGKKVKSRMVISIPFRIKT